MSTFTMVTLLDLFVAAWVGLVDVEGKRRHTWAIQFLFVLVAALSIFALLGGIGAKALADLTIFVIAPTFLGAVALNFVRRRVGKTTLLLFAGLASLLFVAMVGSFIVNFPAET